MKGKVTNKSAPRPRRVFTPVLFHLFFGGVFLILLGFGSLTLFSHNGILDLLRLKSLYHSLQNENAVLLSQQEELQAEVQRLQEPRYLEYLARERLGYMRPNEVFILLDSPKTQSPVDN